MRPDKFILDENGEPVPCEDWEQWGRWLQEHRRDKIVQRDELPQSEGPPILVSTVFLGLDHSFADHGPPVLWETMIFEGPHDQYQERYTSKAAAIKGHAKALRIARGEELGHDA